MWWAVNSLRSILTDMTENTQKSWREKLEKLGDKPTPYILTDLDVVESKVKQLQELLDDVKIYYAIKSNDHPKIIERIDHLVDGYDIASLNEWRQLRDQKISPERILYSNPVKIDEHIQETYRDGVRYYAVDSIDEIKKMSELTPGANIYFRIEVSDHGSRLPFAKKFGLRPDHVLEYADLAKNMGLRVCGLAFHVGSQAENVQVWKRAFEVCGGLIEKLKKQGIEIELLDIGGGFPADYGQPIPSISTVCRSINAGIKKWIPAGVTVAAEPGRFIGANSSILVTKVLAREHRSGTDWLHLDMGVFQGMMEILETKGWKFPVFTDKYPNGYKKDFALAGPTCDGCDVLGTDYLLPSDMGRGDKIYFKSAGAYTTVYGSNFNGFQVPEVYFVNER